MASTWAAVPAVAVAPPATFGATASRPLIIAHRGGSLEAPENTLAAVTHGVQCGADWQEIDVTLTKDEAVVVLHDDALWRTTGAPGLVGQSSQAYVTGLYVGAPRPAADTLMQLQALGVAPPDFAGHFASERLPTLAQVLQVPRAQLMIELKQTGNPERLVGAVAAEVHRAGMARRVALGSFCGACLAAVHALDPTLALIGIAEDTPSMVSLLQLPLAALSVDKRLLQSALRLAPAHIPVWVWTSYRSDEALALAAAGAQGITTDAPAAAVRLLRPDRL